MATSPRDLLSGEWAHALSALFAEGRLRSALLPPGAASAALAEALARDPERTCVLAVLPNPPALLRFAEDARALLRKGGHFRVFPMLDLAQNDPEAIAARLSVLNLLSNPAATPRALVATCVQALLQPSPDPQLTEKLSKHFASGPSCGLEEMEAWLPDNGYRREPEVYEPGTYAVKGGILDVWPAAAGVPTRIEFFGDEVASLRTFNPATQRTDQKIESLRVPPMKLPAGSRRLLHAFLPEGTTVLWVGWDELEAEANAFAETGALAESRRLPAVRATLDGRSRVRQIFLSSTLPDGIDEVELPFQAVDGLAGEDSPFLDPEIMARRRHDLLRGYFRADGRPKAPLRICLDTRGTFQHVREELDGLGVAAGQKEVECRVAPISSGFEIRSGTGRLKAVFLSQSDLFGFRKRGVESETVEGALTPEPDEPESGDDAYGTADVDPAEAIATRVLDTISPGDLVVHSDHGIGRYLGTTEITFGGRRAEVLALEYAQGTKLYVPLSQAHLVSRYAGVNDVPVRLHTLSGKRWTNEKLEAARSVRELAVGMLMRQARRKQLPGHAFAHETPYLEEFEASFPFRETAGQAECIRRVREDMESSHPMDRLVCGDAGYGKTEVALRAAFIAAMQGKQVAVLVPTTVLAQQHYDLFRRRFAAYPLRVALHSRFATQKERAEALEGLADGRVDVIVGTHGILGKNVVYKDLGLVIIDEEQRFGVRDKERLKEVREMVDVLTLSATPIPRTLYLGLTGARDLSLLRTPPPGRVATETKVVPDDDETVRRAILAEVSRGGQVFYLHNRVMTIGLVHERLRRLVPHLRIAVGHGQLSPRETERIMRDFAAGRYDVLLSTTIVENGIDVPRANTILVDRADRFGIADLYQLRGRVGRGSVKAYAYFLIPHEACITGEARERLQALATASRLGAGVSLALRDLSIRGSGNLLGAEQSGHISAVGFSLYCQLLRRAVADLKGEKPPLLVNTEISFPFLATGSGAETPGVVSAFLPYSYIDDDSHRIEFHRRLASCSSERELTDLRREMEDRFGASPRSLHRLYRTTLCRILCAERGIARADLRDGYLYLYRNGTPLRFHGALPRPSGKTPDAALDSILRIVRAQPLVTVPQKPYTSASSIESKDP